MVTLQKRTFNIYLLVTITGLIFQCSTIFALEKSEYYVANGTLILIESYNNKYLEITGELPIPMITYKVIANPEYLEELFVYGYFRNTSDTSTVNIQTTLSTYSDAFTYIMSKPGKFYDYDLFFVSLRYVLPNTFVYSFDKGGFPQGTGPYLLPKGFIHLLTVDEAMPCDQPWYYHLYLTKDTSSRYSQDQIILKAVFQMDMHPVYYCGS